MRAKRKNTYGVPARTLTDAHHGRTTQHVQNQNAPPQPQAALP